MPLPLLGLALMAGGVKRGLELRDQRDEDRRRRLDHEDEDRALQKSQRAFMSGQQQRTLRQQAQADALDESLREAARPAEVRTEQTWQPAVDDEGNAMPPNEAPRRFMVGSTQHASLDEAQQAARAFNSDAAVMRRQSKALRTAGKAAEAIQYAQLADKLEAEGVTAFLDANLARAPAPEVIRKGGLADFDLQGLDDFNATGKVQISPGGKGRWQVLRLPNGQELADFAVVGGDGKPAERVTARQLEAIYGYSRAERDRRASELYAQGKTIDHQARMADAARQRTVNPPAAPLWDDKADEFLKKRYTVTDETGRTTVDGQGLQFAKAVALAQAHRNGGDATAALGFAFDIDNRIRTEAGGDPEKVRAMRAELLQRAAGPAAPAGGREQRPPVEPAAAAGGRVERPPVQARMSAPAREPAPAGSPQAKWDERQAALRQQQADRDAAQAAAAQRVQQQFDADAKALPPLELLTKYQDFGARSALSREQLARLKAAEALVR